MLEGLDQLKKSLDEALAAVDRRMELEASKIRRLERENAELRAASHPAITHNAVCFFPDGNMTCAVFGDFVNLQESPAGFGKDIIDALADLKDKQWIGKNWRERHE